ncbi:unnamed protein product [Laminaria digitata]
MLNEKLRCIKCPNRIELFIFVYRYRTRIEFDFSFDIRYPVHRIRRPSPWGTTVQERLVAKAQKRAPGCSYLQWAVHSFKFRRICSDLSALSKPRLIISVIRDILIRCTHL